MDKNIRCSKERDGAYFRE